MKRFLASALVLSSLSLVTFVGCEDKSGVKSTEKVTTPEGTTTTTVNKKVESTGGDNAPTNSAGETGKTGAPK